MMFCACCTSVSIVTVEDMRRSPLLGSSTERWPVAITVTPCSRGKVFLRPFWSMVTMRSIRSPGSSIPEIELISSTGTVIARWPDATRAEKVGAFGASNMPGRIWSPLDVVGQHLAVDASELVRREGQAVREVGRNGAHREVVAGKALALLQLSLDHHRADGGTEAARLDLGHLA